MMLSLTLDLQEDLSQVAMLRRVSREVLTSFHVAPRDVDDVELLVGELATNAARHGAIGAGSYQVEIGLSDDRVVVTVSDSGKGFCRADALPPGSPRPGTNGEERFGGWGLPLVDQIADRVEFTPRQPTGTRVRAEKHLLHDLREDPVALGK